MLYSVLASANQPVVNSDSMLAIAVDKYMSMIDNMQSVNYFPRSFKEGEGVRWVRTGDWTSGFFPGTLWYLYEFSKDENVLKEAKRFTELIEDQKNNTGTHDLGFMFYCSFGNAFRLTNENYYADVMLTAAKSLNSRFNSNVGCIRSWDFGNWNFPVIVDNMMNLEFMYWAGKYDSKQDYIDNANSHANVTMQHHFRDDFSSYHLVNYNKLNGDVISKETVQGFSKESSWARGQAWGLYGYTMCYRETKDENYLELAEKIAAYILQKLPSDYVPYWDFVKADVEGEPRDASAASLYASAFIELYEITGKSGYLNSAENILINLCSDNYYNKEIDSNSNFLLLHSTGHKPQESEIDVAINYADYYFVEALMRYRNLFNTSNIRSDLDKVPKVFPNPVGEDGRLSVITEGNIKEIAVINIVGQRTVIENINKSEIVLSGFPVGIYHLEVIMNNNERKLTKICIQ